MSAEIKSLCVAVATGRMAAVFLEGNQVIGWKMIRLKAGDTQNAAKVAQSWVEGFTPDHLMIEDTQAASRKGISAQDAIEAVAAVFADASGLDMRLPHQQLYQNKYEEAKALSEMYSEIARMCPTQPPIWLNEPRNITYFEALSLHAQLKQ